MSKINIGVIGAGRIGKIHAENIAKSLNDKANLYAVAEVYMNDEIKAWATGLGATVVTADYKEILADKAVDAIIICSSTNTHAQICIEAAEAGKAIFCEKPIDLELSKIDAVLAAVEKAGVKMQVGFNRRFDHNFKKVKDMVAAGDIGNVEIVKITSRDPKPPSAEYARVSGGMFLDMTIHDFDMARYLSGSEITEIYVNGACLVDEEIGKAGDLDTALISLKFANGAVGVIDNSRRAAYGYDQRVEVFGSKGCVSADNDRPTSVILSTEQGVSSEKPLYFFLERYTQSFIDEMRDFINAVVNDAPTPVCAIDGLKPVVIALAAKESYTTGKPVTIK